jgi:CheY-like chemotaxis protein
MGAHVQLVGSVDDALAAIAHERPHVLISDVAMPAKDGYALIERVRVGDGGGRRLPAIAVTAYAGADDVKRALDAGYDLHVAKPVDAATLARSICDLIGPVLETSHQTADITRPIAIAER